MNVDANSEVEATEEAMKIISYSTDVYNIGATTVKGKERMSEWISVKERMLEDDLPENSKRQRITVLICVNCKTVSEASRILISPLYRKTGNSKYELVKPEYRRWKWSKDKVRVTHRMPLPKPPKEGEK